MPSFGTDDLVGRSLGGYELRHLLGAGGMGAVYRAYQPNLNRDVAVKVLPSALASETGYLLRFQREAKTAASLEHPHIVPVYDYGTENGISYIVMRLMTGGSLSARLSERPLTIEEILRLVDDVAVAIDYAHSENVIHRDIKASNVLFDRHREAYLADFGIAWLTTDATHLTDATDMMGTPSYMAPELWRDEQPSPATDIYALGILVTLMLTGTLPFKTESQNLYAMMHHHLYDKPPSLHESHPEYPPAVDAVVGLALAKKADARFHSAGEFAASLKAVLGGGFSESPTFTIAAKSDDTTIPARIIEDMETTPNKIREILPPYPPAGSFAPREMPNAPLKRTPKRIPALRLPCLLLVGLISLVSVGTLVAYINSPTLSDAPPTATLELATTAVAIAPTVPAETLVPTDTSAPTATPSSTVTPSATLTNTNTQSPQPSVTPTHTLTMTSTAAASPPPTRAATPSVTIIPGRLTDDRRSVTIPVQWIQGEVVNLSLSRLPSADNLDPYLQLMDEHGDEIKANDDCGGGVDSCILNIVVPASGTYSIVVSSFNQASIGQYDLKITSFRDCGTPVIAWVSGQQPIRFRAVPAPDESWVIGTIEPNECFPIIGRSANDMYWQIQLFDGGRTWVAKGSVTAVGDSSAVPLIPD